MKPEASFSVPLEPHTCESLQNAYRNLKDSQPQLRVRDAASLLGVGELVLVASGLDDRSFLLRPEPKSIIAAMPTVGRVMCLCRNTAAVHERYGAFDDVHADGDVGLVLGADIDLRLFFTQWHHGLYLTQDLASGLRESFQFFDSSGDAILKIYATADTDLAAFRSLAQSFRARNHQPRLVTSRPPAPEPMPNRASREGLREAWQGMRDTHEFHGILRKLELDRLKAFEQVGEDYAARLPLECVENLLSSACEAGVPIMVFVNNPGCIQIHSGSVTHFKRTGGWLNILDPIFNLHLQESVLSSVWRVRKPSVDGTITSVEVFDDQHRLCLQLFGARKPGIPERRDWRNLVAEIETGTGVAA